MEFSVGASTSLGRTSLRERSSIHERAANATSASRHECPGTNKHHDRRPMTAIPPSPSSPAVDAVLVRRFEYLTKETREFIHTTGRAERDLRASITAQPRLSSLGNRATYVTQVRGELVPWGWSEELRDIIGRARSLLDNALWVAAGGDEPGRYSSGEQGGIKFPIAHTTHDWTQFEGTRHAQFLAAGVLMQLRQIQPFVTGQPVIRWLNRTNNRDKHRYPLVLDTMPDGLFAMLFARQVAAVPGVDKPGVTWAPLEPVRDGKILVECTHPLPLRDLAPTEVPVALCVDVDGHWVDVQEFLQDAIEFVARVVAILGDGDTTWADDHRRKFDAERAQLADFRKMMQDNDSAAEARWRATGPII